MISPSAIHRLGSHVAAFCDTADDLHALAAQLGLDQQDEATLFRLASGEAILEYFVNSNQDVK